MNRVLNQVHFLGTGKLLELTKDMNEEDRKKILKYISELETNQKFVAEKFWELCKVISFPAELVITNCYYCHGVGCEKCIKED